MILKKIIIYFMFLTLLTLSGFSATVVIDNCNTLPTSNNDYIFSESYFHSSNNCFNFEGLENISVDGNLTENWDYEVFMKGNLANNITIQNMSFKHMEFSGSMGAYNFTLDNIYTSNQENMFYSEDSLSTSVVQRFYNITINNSRFMSNSRHSFALSSDPSGGSGGKEIKFANMTITNTDFIGFNKFYQIANNNVGYFNDSLRIENSNFATQSYAFSGMSYQGDCLDFDVTGNNNYWSGEVFTDLANDGTADETFNRQLSTCDVYVGTIPSKSIPKNENRYLSQASSEVLMGYVPSSPTGAWTYDTQYIYTKGQEVNSTNVFNLQGSVFNSILDFSAIKNNYVAVSVENIFTFRMGINNKIFGGYDLSDKPQINTVGVIPGVYTGIGNIYDSLNHIIDYSSKTTIDNIDFNLNAVGNYILVRKTSLNVQGDFLTLKNSLVDINYVPTTVTTPMFFSGTFLKLINNTFDAGNQQNLTMFSGGTGGGASGGHLIIGNTFNGGGLIFQELQAGGTAFENKFIHNSFTNDGGTYYSLPFSLLTNSLFTDLDMNGSYYHKTVCDSYEFNIGNHYETFVDNTLCQDTTPADGFCDSQPFSVGFLINGSDILDHKTVYTYPYDFAGNIGSHISYTDLCGLVTWNVITPINNTNYTGGVIETDWEFITSAYSSLNCFENINDWTGYYENVASGNNKGTGLELSSGYYEHQVICCDTDQCDNVVKESPVTEFCMGGVCDTPGIVLDEFVPGGGAICGNSIIESGETCDDGNTISGDGCSATCQTEGGGGIDPETGLGFVEGSELINVNDISGTTDNTLGFMANIMAFIVNVGIPLAIFIVIIMVVLAVVMMIK